MPSFELSIHLPTNTAETEPEFSVQSVLNGVLIQQRDTPAPD